MAATACRTGRTGSGSAWARQVDLRSPTAAARPAPNIYRVEGGCITKLETLLQEHLRVSGAVGLGTACVWVFSVPFTSCWYRSLKLSAVVRVLGSQPSVCAAAPRDAVTIEAPDRRLLRSRTRLCPLPCRGDCVLVPGAPTVPSPGPLGTPRPHRQLQVPLAAHQSPKA